jgi:hypothetical protein
MGNNQAANLLFALVSRRFERGSIIVTSNRSFEQWGEIPRRRHSRRGPDRPARPPRHHGAPEGQELLPQTAQYQDRARRPGSAAARLRLNGGTPLHRVVHFSVPDTGAVFQCPLAATSSSRTPVGVYRAYIRRGTTLVQRGRPSPSQTRACRVFVCRSRPGAPPFAASCTTHDREAGIGIDSLTANACDAASRWSPKRSTLEGGSPGLRPRMRDDQQDFGTTLQCGYAPRS